MTTNTLTCVGNNNRNFHFAFCAMRRFSPPSQFCHLAGYRLHNKTAIVTTKSDNATLGVRVDGIAYTLESQYLRKPFLRSIFAGWISMFEFAKSFKSNRNVGAFFLAYFIFAGPVGTGAALGIVLLKSSGLIPPSYFLWRS